VDYSVAKHPVHVYILNSLELRKRQRLLRKTLAGILAILNVSLVIIASSRVQIKNDVTLLVFRNRNDTYDSLATSCKLLSAKFPYTFATCNM